MKILREVDGDFSGSGKQEVKVTEEDLTNIAKAFSTISTVAAFRGADLLKAHNINPEEVTNVDVVYRVGGVFYMFQEKGCDGRSYFGLSSEKLLMTDAEWQKDLKRVKRAVKQEG